MFIAVGDEGCQRVDMVGVLHHWDFIGLLMKKKNHKEVMSNVQVSDTQQSECNPL